jgi:hypothetical protein
VIGKDERAKFTKGEAVSVYKVLNGKLRVKQNWKTKRDTLDEVLGE